MKKIFPILVAICLIVPTMLILGSNFSVSEAKKPIRQNSVLTNIFGDVWVKHAGDGELVPATEDMTLKTGDIIFSGDSSSVSLTYFDGSSTLIFPNTVLEIAEMSTKEDGSGKVIRSYQWLGRTLNRVEKLLDTESRYEIETSNAVTAVRGTQFMVVVVEDGTTQVDVIEGIVDVTSQGETVKVKEKQATSVHPGEKPAKVIPSVINPNDGNNGNSDGNPGGGNDNNPNNGNSDGNPGNSGDNPGNSGDNPGNSGDNPGNSGDNPGNSGDNPGNSGDNPGNSGDNPGNSGDNPGNSGDNPGNSGDNPGNGGDNPGNGGDNPGNGGDNPGNSGSGGGGGTNNGGGNDKDKSK